MKTLKPTSSLFLALALTACGSRIQEPGTDSNTHWLGICSDDSDCPADGECLCGSCTLKCENPSACDALGSGGICATISCSDDSQPIAVCSVACSLADSCPSGSECVAGTCRLRNQCDPGTSCTSSECDGGDCSSAEVTQDAGPTDANAPLPAVDAAAETSSVATSTASAVATSSSPSPSSDAAATSPIMEAGVDAGSPPGCEAMDAEDDGTDCPGTTQYVWNGQDCLATHWCGCTGTDCAAVFDSLDECKTRKAACIDAIPLCSDGYLELTSIDPGYTPQDDPYKVFLQSPRLAESDAAAPPFTEWTTALWEGWEDLPILLNCSDTGPCPTPMQLELDVDGQRVLIQVSVEWGNIDVYTPESVEFRLVYDSSSGVTEPVELQVLESGSGIPVVYAATGGGRAGATNAWDFDPIHVRTGSPLCKALDVNPCNFLFVASELQVQFGDADPVTLGIFESTEVSATLTQGENLRYQVAHSFSYSGNLPAYAQPTCASLIPRRDGFFIHRLADQP